MISFFNKPNISVDLDKFISGEVPKLLVIGESGAGKSVASKYLAKKYDVPHRSTDEFMQANFDLFQQDPDEFRRQRKVFEDALFKSSERMVLEGAGIHRRPVEEILKHPAVILGKSGFNGAFDAARRNVRKGLYRGKFWPEFKVAFGVNWRKLSRQVSEYRQQRISQPGANIEKISIPHLED